MVRLQVVKQLGIITMAELTVIVSPERPKWYITENASVSIGWSPVSGAMCTLTLNWGDGIVETKTVQYPGSFVHKYTVTGSYPVKAMVKDNSTKAQGEGQGLLQVAELPEVAFVADKTSGVMPLTVTFTCTARGGFPNYTWVLDYGDGTTAYSGSGWDGASFTKSHIYEGAATAKLTITDTLGKMAEKTLTIKAEPLEVDFTSNKISGTVPLKVIFTCGASKGSLDYTWVLDPGDGSASYSGTRMAEGTWTQSHTYKESDTFTAKLTVADAFGRKVEKVLTIEVTEVPEVLPWWWWLAAIAGGATLITVIGVVVYQEEERHRMMLAIATR